MIAESRLTDPYVRSFLLAIEHFCKLQNLLTHVEFPADHPIEEMGRYTISFMFCSSGLMDPVIASPIVLRLLLAVLLRHNDLPQAAADLAVRSVKIQAELIIDKCPLKIPQAIGEIIRVVHQTKWSLIKVI